MRGTCGPLEVHSNTAPVPNNRWDKETLSAMELEGIRPFLNQIRAKKDQGLSGVGVVASFIRRQVQLGRRGNTMGSSTLGQRTLPG